MPIQLHWMVLWCADVSLIMEYNPEYDYDPNTYLTVDLLVNLQLTKVYLHTLLQNKISLNTYSLVAEMVMARIDLECSDPCSFTQEINTVKIKLALSVDKMKQLDVEVSTPANYSQT